MVKRIRIGLIYSYNTNWIAGSYYILNLIHALNKQHELVKPELIIFSYKKEEYDTIKECGYPFLSYHELKPEYMLPAYSFIDRGINFIFRKITGRNVIQKKHTSKRLNIHLDLLFPANNHAYFSKVKNSLYWIPDFQERFLPHFFSEEEIQTRKYYQQKLSEKKQNIVFSSYDALRHFQTFYPRSNAKTFVLHFAVTHPVYTNISLTQLHSKFSINGPYIFCSNQVWQHKNHLTVLKAVKKLKEKDENILILFSGKESDNRNPHFFEKLKDYIVTHKLDECIKFLGFIDRKEQLQLMKNAVCILQPSLFEGWNTSVEDAKAMHQPVIASDIPVHREQLGKNAFFFEPENEIQLAEYLKKAVRYHQLPTVFRDYNPEIVKFGAEFIEIANQITSGK